MSVYSNSQRYYALKLLKINSTIKELCTAVKVQKLVLINNYNNDKNIDNNNNNMIKNWH